MKLKLNKWINVKTGTVWFGVQALSDGKWMNCCIDSKPLFFRKRERAEAYIKRNSKP